MFRTIFKSAYLLCLVSAPAMAWAQESGKPAESEAQDNGQLEEVVVTAQRRLANIQDVPVAVTAISGDRLQEAGVRDARDLQQFVPNLQFNNISAASSTSIFIRGVGISDFNANTTGAIGVYVDDVFIAANAGKLFSIFDSEGIEVLRGPQGTLYGRNTTGGAIRFISKRPTNNWSGDAELTYGNFDNVRFEGGVGGPIVEDRLKIRLSGFRETRDGYVTNLVNGHKLNDIDAWAARAMLEFTPGPDTSVLLSVNVGKNDSGARQFAFRGQLPGNSDLSGYAPADDDVDTQSYNVEGKEKLDVFGSSLKIEHDFGGATLTSISAYQYVKRRTLEDGDAGPSDILSGIYSEDPRQLSQEIRLQSPADRRFTWIAGAFFLKDTLRTKSSLNVLGILRDPTAPFNGADPANFIGNLEFPYRQTTHSAALFGQADYKITDRLTATVGLRYSRDRIKLDYLSYYIEPEGIIPGTELAFADSKSFNDLSYRVALNFKPNDDHLLYASFSTGYNAGGFPGGSATNLDELKPYGSEKLYAWEAGWKGDLFDRRLRIAATGFYYDYKNIQVYILDDSGVLPVQRKGNADGAEIYGFEAEIFARPVKALQLSLAAGYTHARYRTFIVPPNDFTGNTLTNSPKFTLSGSIDYTQQLGSLGELTARVDGFAQSKIFFQPANDPLYGQGGYHQFNAQLIFRPANSGFQASLWVKNFTNERFVTAAYPIITSDQLNYNEPRTYGVRLGYHF